MRIAIMVRGLSVGGMQRVAISLADAFHTQGHETHLIYFKHKGNVLFPNEPVFLHNIQLKRIMNLSGIGLIWKFVSKILNLLMKGSYFVWTGLLMAPIFKFKLKQLESQYGTFDLIIFRGQGTFEMIWPIHDDRFVFVNENVLPFSPDKPFHKLYSHLLFKDRNIACVSQGVQESFHQLETNMKFNAKKSVTITNLIDVAQTQTKADEYVPNIDQNYILSAGRLVPQKNVPLLVDAYAYARKELGLKHLLVILGDGKEQAKVESRIQEHNISEYVKMVPPTNNPFPWMKHADLFVLSSKHEGLGMVLLEAMACGTNVVATDSPGGVRNVMTGDLRTQLSEQTPQALGEKIMETLNKDSIDFSPYFEPYLPKSITNQFIHEFIESSKRS